MLGTPHLSLVRPRLDRAALMHEPEQARASVRKLQPRLLEACDVEGNRWGNKMADATYSLRSAWAMPGLKGACSGRIVRSDPSSSGSGRRPCRESANRPRSERRRPRSASRRHLSRRRANRSSLLNCAKPPSRIVPASRSSTVSTGRRLRRSSRRRPPERSCSKRRERSAMSSGAVQGHRLREDGLGGGVPTRTPTKGEVQRQAQGAALRGTGPAPGLR